MSYLHRGQVITISLTFSLYFACCSLHFSGLFALSVRFCCFIVSFCIVVLPSFPVVFLVCFVVKFPVVPLVSIIHMVLPSLSLHTAQVLN